MSKFTQIGATASIVGLLAAGCANRESSSATNTETSYPSTNPTITATVQSVLPTATSLSRENNEFPLSVNCYGTQVGNSSDYEITLEGGVGEIYVGSIVDVQTGEPYYTTFCSHKLMVL